MKKFKDSNPNYQVNFMIMDRINRQDFFQVLFWFLDQQKKLTNQASIRKTLGLHCYQ